METSTQTIKRPAINIVAIRDLIKNTSSINEKDAEAIASAINESIIEQDTTGFATKNDISDIKGMIKDLKIEIYKMHLSTVVLILGAVSKMLKLW